MSRKIVSLLNRVVRAPKGYKPVAELPTCLCSNAVFLPCTNRKRLNQVVLKKRIARMPQRGSSMVEFLIIMPLLLFIGMGVMQFGLVYHAKSMLNYATFEAARTGAVNNGQIDIMRKELGYRLAPVFGGTGSLRDGTQAIVRSKVIANDPTATKIEILNPTSATFAEHGAAKSVEDSHGNQRDVVAIPNSHLRSRDHQKIKSDGLNIQDANLLKIRVTYGYQMQLPFLDMEVPGMRLAMRTVMLHADPDNWMFYLRGMLPIQSTATVRMQSEAWDGQLEPPEVKVFDSMYAWTLEEIELQEQNPDDNDNDPTDPSECNDNGLNENEPTPVHNPDECHKDDNHLDDLTDGDDTSC